MQTLQKEMCEIGLTLHVGSTSILPQMSDDNPQDQRLWAMVRIALGLLQMAGGIASVVLLITVGVTTLTVAVAVVTGFFLAMSWTLFRAK